MQRTFLACAVAGLFGIPAAQAAGDADLAAIREQINQMKQQYETRIQALEQRLAEAETRAAGAAKAADTAPAPSRKGGEAAFNPGISLILSGTWASLKEDPDNHQITGFVPTGGEVGPGRRGLSLAESELILSANIDHLFRGQFTAALTPENEVEVEEATIQALALPHGFTAKAGRFLSGIGYMNEQHAHTWDFVDAPLPYKAFLGNQVRDDGVQVKWLAPTDLFVELGAEAGRGLAFPGGDRNKNGIAAGALFAHVGGDLGDSHSWRAGLSYLKSSATDRRYDDLDSAGTAVTHSFQGDSRLWITDFVWKWQPAASRASLKLQGEYFRRKESGNLTFDVDGASGVLAGPATGSYASTQSGWYLQGVYQFASAWRLGLRADKLKFGTQDIGLVNSGTLSAADFPVLAQHDPKRFAAMLDWSPSEFSRWRLQLGSDDSRPGVTDRQLYLQYIMTLGAHGAHKY
jgi:hypothetical protein